MTARRGRPPANDPRSHVFKFTANDVERAEILERQHASGLPMAVFLRARALGSKPRGVVRPAPEPKRAPGTPSPAAVAVGVERQTIADEIAEAQLDDPTARDAYIARRALQLHGQGRTMLVARREAADEWARR